MCPCGAAIKKAFGSETILGFTPEVWPHFFGGVARKRLLEGAHKQLALTIKEQGSG